MSKKDKQSTISLSTGNTLLIIIKKAFEIKKGPFPWPKAISAAICAGFPVIIGLLVGQLHLGLLGGIGSFSYLYVFNEPYAERAKKYFLLPLVSVFQLH